LRKKEKEGEGIQVIVDLFGNELFDFLLLMRRKLKKKMGKKSSSPQGVFKQNKGKNL